jgi:hypothetical protein
MMKVEKKLKFTFIIVKRDACNKVVNYLKNLGIEDYFSFYGKGSARVAILDYLGIGESENNILVYPTNEDDGKLIIKSLRNSEYLKDVIAFRVPIKGVSSMNALNYFLKEEKESE